MRAAPTVFVVDDDDAVRRTLARSLRHRGFSVEAFATAESFLAAIDGNRSGCLVLDVAMPGMNGLELQDELVRRGWALPIIFITGHGDAQMATRAIRTGAVDFLEKPFRPDLLLERIEEALQQDADQSSRTTPGGHP